jgi:HSP20 family protein
MASGRTPQVFPDSVRRGIDALAPVSIQWAAAEELDKETERGRRDKSKEKKMIFGTQVRRNPVDHHVALIRDAERALAGFHRRSFPTLGGALVEARPAMQSIRAVENTDDYVVTADVPGVAPEDLSVAVEAGLLTLSGTRKSLDWSEDLSDEEKEAHSSRFERCVRFNGEIDQEGVTARSRNGQLRIVVPKLKPPVPEVTEVRVQTA